MKKKILITGCSGFLATNLINKLVKKKNFKIYALSKKKLKYPQKIISKNIKFIHCDITNYSKLKKKIDKKYSIVINFAGNIDHKNKIQTYKAHYSGLKNLIKCINIDKIKLFLQIGSSMEYGYHKSPHSEDLICKPKSYYGRAKHLASSYISKKLKNYVILRLYQVYGPYQKNNRLLPIVINSCLKKKIIYLIYKDRPSGIEKINYIRQCCNIRQHIGYIIGNFYILLNYFVFCR